jgi:hypothetical protein
MSKTAADSRLARHLTKRPALGPFISLRLSYGHTPPAYYCQLKFSAQAVIAERLLAFFRAYDSLVTEAYCLGNRQRLQIYPPTYYAAVVQNVGRWIDAQCFCLDKNSPSFRCQYVSHPHTNLR